MNGNAIGNALRSIAEALGGDARCSTCREWRDVRVVWPDGACEPLPDTLPERCPHCGWEPMTVAVWHVPLDRGR